MLYSLIVPVYKNEQFIEKLLDRIHRLYEEFEHELEAIFVVDHSPDDSFQKLQRLLPTASFPSELINLAKNFGPASAVRMGLSVARGKYYAAMAADLQEPYELIATFFRTLRDEPVDLVVGKRIGRDDPMGSKISSNIFWKLYKKFVQQDMPAGGIDIFGCNSEVKNALLQLNESNTSMAGQLIWLGFRRKDIPYHRQAREFGKSSWSFRRKVRYMLDSIFSFTDLPITIIMFLGCFGLFSAFMLSFLVFVSWKTGTITVPGYTPTILIMLFSLSLILIALGIIGNYVWRSFENTKNRPIVIPMQRETFHDNHDAS